MFYEKIFNATSDLSFSTSVLPVQRTQRKQIYTNKLYILLSAIYVKNV